MAQRARPCHSRVYAGGAQACDWGGCHRPLWLRGLPQASVTEGAAAGLCDWGGCHRRSVTEGAATGLCGHNATHPTHCTAGAAPKCAAPERVAHGVRNLMWAPLPRVTGHWAGGACQAVRLCRVCQAVQGVPGCARRARLCRVCQAVQGVPGCAGRACCNACTLCRRAGAVPTCISSAVRRARLYGAYLLAIYDKAHL